MCTSLQGNEVFLASIPFGIQGSSSLLNKLFLRNFTESRHKYKSPLHINSVDVGMAGSGHLPFHVLDLHAGSQADVQPRGRFAFEQWAVMKTLRFAQVCDLTTMRVFPLPRSIYGRY